MRRAVGRVARPALRSGVPAGVVARRHADRVLGVAARRLPRHPGRRARVGTRRGDHARSRDRHVAGVVARRHDAVLRQRSHRDPNIYAYDIARPRDVAGHQRARRRVPRRRRRPTARASRSRRRSPRAATTSTSCAIDRATWLPARDYVDDRPPPTVGARRRGEGQRAAPVPRRSSRSRRSRGSLQLDARRGAERDDPDRRRRRGRAPLVLADDRRRTSTTGDAQRRRVVRLRRLAAGGLRFAAARTLRRARRLPHRRRAASVSSEEDWSATLVDRASRSSRGPSASWTLSFDYDVDWFRARRASR